MKSYKLKDKPLIRKVVKVGNSLGIIFTKELCEQYSIELGDKLNLEDIVIIKE